MAKAQEYMPRLKKVYKETIRQAGGTRGNEIALQPDTQRTRMRPLHRFDAPPAPDAGRQPRDMDGGGFQRHNLVGNGKDSWFRHAVNRR